LSRLEPGVGSVRSTDIQTHSCQQHTPLFDCLNSPTAQSVKTDHEFVSRTVTCKEKHAKNTFLRLTGHSLHMQAVGMVQKLS